MYGINSEPPKNCLDCPLCQGEYGPGNEKSYCAIKSKIKLKYKGSRPKECPIIKVRLQEEITNDDIQQAIKEGFANGYEMAKSKYERPQGEWIEFAHWVAKEVLDDYFEESSGAFAEIACRKLVKLGLVEVKDNVYKMKGGAE